MVVIYDFDGTLTPYSAPQYEIIKKLGYNQESFFKRMTMEKERNKNFSMYELFYKCYNDILEENNIPKTEENICLGAERVLFNHGVVDYFEKYQSLKTGIKHYIVTSGLKDYVLKTPIGQYVDGVYGVTYEKNGDKYGAIKEIISDERKVDAIKDIQVKNKNTRSIIYFGDGPTDKRAFEYVYSIGGRNIFILSNEDSLNKYHRINENGIIDKMFLADFSDGSKIDSFIGGRLEYLKKQEREMEGR